MSPTKSIEDVERHVKLVLKNCRSESESRLFGYNIAKMYHGAKCFSQAERFLADYISLRPSDSKAHKLMGDIMCEQKLYNGALAAYKQAIQLKPDFRDALVNRALMAARYLESTVAAECIEHLSKMYPSDLKLLEIREVMSYNLHKNNENDVMTKLETDARNNSDKIEVHLKFIDHLLTAQRYNEAYNHAVETDSRGLFTDLRWYKSVSTTIESWIDEEREKSDEDTLRDAYLHLLLKYIQIFYCAVSSSSVHVSSNYLQKFDQTFMKAFCDFPIKSLQHHSPWAGTLRDLRGLLYNGVALLVLKQYNQGTISPSVATETMVKCSFFLLEQGLSTNLPLSKTVCSLYQERFVQMSYLFISLFNSLGAEECDNIMQSCSNDESQLAFCKLIYPFNFDETISFLAADRLFARRTTLSQELHSDIHMHLQKLNDYFNNLQSLDDIVWILLVKLNFPGKREIDLDFEWLYSLLMKFCDDENGDTNKVSKIDIQAFLTAVAIWSYENLKFSQQFQFMPLPQVMNNIVTTSQRNVWEALTKVSKLDNASTLFRQGLNTIRCLESSCFPISILVEIAQSFAKIKFKGVMNTYMTSRAELYWKEAVKHLQLLKRGLTFSSNEKHSLFPTKVLTPLSNEDIPLLIEEGLFFIAKNHESAGRLESAITTLEEMQNPHAYLSAARIYRKMAAAQDKSARKAFLCRAKENYNLILKSRDSASRLVHEEAECELYTLMDQLDISTAAEEANVSLDIMSEQNTISTKLLRSLNYKFDTFITLQTKMLSSLDENFYALANDVRDIRKTLHTVKNSGNFALKNESRIDATANIIDDKWTSSVKTPIHMSEEPPKPFHSTPGQQLFSSTNSSPLKQTNRLGLEAIVQKSAEKSAEKPEGFPFPTTNDGRSIPNFEFASKPPVFCELQSTKSQDVSKPSPPKIASTLETITSKADSTSIFNNQPSGGLLLPNTKADSSIESLMARKSFGNFSFSSPSSAPFISRPTQSLSSVTMSSATSIFTSLSTTTSFSTTSTATIFSTPTSKNLFSFAPSSKPLFSASPVNSIFSNTSFQTTNSSIFSTPVISTSTSSSQVVSNPPVSSVFQTSKNDLSSMFSKTPVISSSPLSNFITQSTAAPKADQAVVTSSSNLFGKSTNLFAKSTDNSPASSSFTFTPSSTCGMSLFNQLLDSKSLFPTTTVTASKDEEPVNVESPDTSFDPHYEPIVELTRQEVTTGEENDEALFDEHAKLYRFDGQWKERGVGNIKILKTQDHKFRITMRRDQVKKICANHFITKEMKLLPHPSASRSWLWTANDYADEESKIEKLAIRFKEENLAKKFKDVFEDCVAKLSTGTKLPAQVSAASATEKPAVVKDVFAKFKMKDYEWKCDKCLIVNHESKALCAACQSPKPTELKSAVKPEVSTRAANTVNTPIQTNPLQKFIKANDEWDCQACLVRNKIKDKECVCCKTPNPEFESAENSKADIGGFAFSRFLPGSSNTNENDYEHPTLESVCQAAGVNYEENSSEDEDYYYDDEENGSETEDVPEYVSPLRRQTQQRKETNSPAQENDDVVFIKSVTSDDYSENIKEFLLPPLFYSYLNAKPCSGCIGCDSEDGRQVNKMYKEEIKRITDVSVTTSSLFGGTFAMSSSVPIFGSQSSTATTSSIFGNVSSTPIFGFGSDTTFASLCNTSSSGFSSLTPGSSSQFAARPLFENQAEITETNEEVENLDIHFEPIVHLTQVKVQSGEENDEIVYKNHLKLYRFSDKQWKERGVGDLKLLRNKNTGVGRLIMRRDQIHKLCANHVISSSLELKPFNNSDKAWTWMAHDYSDSEEGSVDVLAIRFKTPELAAEFKKAFDSLKT